MFIKNQNNEDYIFGYTNSKVFQEFLNISCQGLHYSNGVISNLPIVYTDKKEIKNMFVFRRKYGIVRPYKNLLTMES